MWPLIADLYTPVLGGLVFGVAYRAKYLKAVVFMLLVSFGLIFGFSALEHYLGLWRSWGLDYSTHTAVLLPLYQSLWALALLPVADKPSVRPWLISLTGLMVLVVALLSGAGYGLLMMELDYHTFADILTTVVSTYPLVWISFRLMGNLFDHDQTKEAAAANKIVS